MRVVRAGAVMVTTTLLALVVVARSSGERSASAAEEASRASGASALERPREPEASEGWPSPEHLDQDEDTDDAGLPEAVEVPHAGHAPLRERDGMVFVPGAQFSMGSMDKRAPRNERPPASVKVRSFWIDRTEVTVAAYRACVARGACARPARTSPACTYDKDEPELPVSCVSWSSASAFCAAAGKRLPREAEWELAARGVKPARYPWGGKDTACRLAVTLVREHSQRSCGGNGPKKVASCPLGQSPFGALDMSGNVEEWTSDFYAETLSAGAPRAGASHVLRGGGFLTSPSRAQTTSRSWGSAAEAGPNVGFRCARDDRRMR